MPTALSRTFRSGNSQAVRLPKAKSPCPTTHP